MNGTIYAIEFHTEKQVGMGQTDICCIFEHWGQICIAFSTYVKQICIICTFNALRRLLGINIKHAKQVESLLFHICYFKIGKAFSIAWFDRVSQEYHSAFI